MSLPKSGTMMSLGHRLKAIAQYIKPNETEGGGTRNPTDEVDESKFEAEGGQLDDTKSGVELENKLKGLKEIAKVEGYDENSYVMTTINDICKKAYTDPATAAKNIATIIKEVMPFDYQEFFDLFDATTKTAEQLDNKVCWVLLGPTGAGKSTSIHYFCGSQFIRGNGGKVIVKKCHAALQKKDIKVGVNLIDSCTRYIEEVKLDLKQYSKSIRFSKKEPTQILWVDSPGFEDTAGPEVNIANGIGTVRALKRAKKVKILITFKEAHMDYRFKIIRSIAGNMGKAVIDLEELLDKKDSPIAAFLTKSTHGKEQAQKEFDKAYEEAEAKDAGSDENAIFKSLLYKVGKAGPLYEIKIDVDNNKNNETSRVNIIKSLVEDVGYIDSPDETFSEFISESSLSKVKEQIEKTQNTIQNILDNDEYFENPKCVNYIITILNDLTKLKDIIKNAGGKFVESRLEECVDILKKKWNAKIIKCNNILSSMDIKDCKIGRLQKKLTEFEKIKRMMTVNIKVMKSCAFYSELEGVSCLNEALHESFDEIYKTIKDYLDTITNTLKSDDSGDETEADVKENEIQSPRPIIREGIDDDNYEDNYNDEINEKIILECIKKCYLLYGQYPKDKYIKRKIQHYEKLKKKVFKKLTNKLDRFMRKNIAQNVNGVQMLMFMFTNLYKLHNINNSKMVMSPSSLSAPLISREGTIDPDDDDDDEVEHIIKEATNKLKNNISKSISRICNDYSLTPMPITQLTSNSSSTQKQIVDVTTILKSKITTDEDIRSREEKLISFCKWINKLYQSICDTKLGEIKIFHNLQKWLNDTRDNWIDWLCTACSNELKECNNLLNDENCAQYWNDVEKLLKECESLRKVDDVANNTSKDYFKILSEFESSKTELAENAARLMGELGNDEKKINYDAIIQIANQLYNAGCSEESSDMKKIYNKLKQRFHYLKDQTEAMDLSIDTPDELVIVQNTMKELDTLGKFSAFMKDVKKDASECYQILNQQVLDVLNEIKKNYDLSKYSTENSRTLKAKLIEYKNIKEQIDENVLNIIIRCRKKTITDLVNLNVDKINKLEDRNKTLDEEMTQKCGTVMEEIKTNEKLKKTGKRIMINGEDGDLDEWLKANNLQSLKQIGIKLTELNEKSNSVVHKEKTEKSNNINDIQRLNNINKEAQKLVTIEHDLMSLQPSKVVDYRSDDNFLKSSIKKLEKLLEKNHDYIFPEKLEKTDAYNALTFLHQSKQIKWSLINKNEEKKDENAVVLSNNYVNEINKNLLKYLKAYGDILEAKLNDLIGNLAVTDVAKKNLNDMDYITKTQNTIVQLTNAVREFRDISNFDRRIKMNMEDDYDDNQSNKRRRQLRLVTCLFTNHDIQLSVDGYINNTFSMHKQDISINFNQWKVNQPEKLPILRHICLAMSSLDRFVSNKDNINEDTYMRLATMIDSALTDFGKDNTKDIMTLFNDGSWGQLNRILDPLKKTAAADEHGVAYNNYRTAVMKLFAALNKLIGETKSKLLIEIGPDSDVNVEKIISLKQNLDNVKNAAEVLYPHLTNNKERKKVKNEEKALGTLLFDRLKILMRAAAKAAKKWDFKTCEKRLENISRLMDHNAQSYIDVIDTDDGDNDKQNDDENKNGEPKEEKEYVNKIVDEYNKIQQQIDGEINQVLEQVEHANKGLSTNVFSPYNCLKLKTLHDQLTKSNNDKFETLWNTIHEEIVNSITNILNEIKERNNQIQMRTEIQMGNQMNKEMMSYSQQEQYIGKIERSLSVFPLDLKNVIAASLKETKEGCDNNITFIGEGFDQFLESNSWNEIARNLTDFENNNPKFFQSSRQKLLTKISGIYQEFDTNMKKGNDGFVDNLPSLGLYKSIGLCFTKLKYIGNSNNGDNVYVLRNVQGRLEQLYKDIETKFTNKCDDIRSSLNGHKKFIFLKDGFEIVIKVLEHKGKLPQKYIKSIANETDKLFKPMKKLINTLKLRKTKGLDRTLNDIEPLLQTLNDLKELTAARFHSNVRKMVPFMHEKDEKENKENIIKLEKDIENIEYNSTVKQTKKMITEYKDIISKEGLNRELIQKNQAKRVKYLKDVSMKCKALIKCSAVSKAHFEIEEKVFNKQFVKPCTQRMGKDIKQMQKETLDAFTKGSLNIKDLQRANANFEAFHAVKEVFEKEINDEKLCKEIQINDAIEVCQNTAQAKVTALSLEIEQKYANTDEYFDKCAENLMNLEYMNQHMNFKTSINPNAVNIENDIHKDVKHAISKTMSVLSTKKVNFNKLHSCMLDVDSNYGVAFSQQHKVFKQSLQAAMNDKFLDLGIKDLIKKLEQSAKELSKFDVTPINTQKIESTFQKILKMYQNLVMTNLSTSKSFEQLIKQKVTIIATDARTKACNALRRKQDLLGKAKKGAWSIVSWVVGQDDKSKNNPRDCFWTTEMKGAIPELIAHVLAAWTLSNASGYYECEHDKKSSLMWGRNAQIIAIICILCLDIDSKETKKLINNLVEVGTGEGKSVIMAVTAIVLALLEFDVYCACYSELLSKRDQDSFYPLFLQFGVQNNIKYHTFNKILEEMINADGDIREITKDIVLDKSISVSDEKKDDDLNILNKRQKILFIDEVDKFFSTDFFGKQFIPSCVIPKEEMKELILFVWNEYINNDSNAKVITIQKIEQSNEYKAVLKAFHSEWHDLINESVKDIIDGIQTFKEDQYKIEKGKNIAYKFSDTYSSKVFYGYRTLFTYLFELHNGNITDEQHVHKKLTWFLTCGSFSYSEIPNNFYAILGVTGTLKALSTKEHQVIQGSYGIKKYIMMPSLFDKKGKLAYAQNKHIHISPPEHFFSQLKDQIRTSLINEEGIDRPVIVFFKSEEMLNKFYNNQACDDWRVNERIQLPLLTPDLTETEKKHGILNATKTNMITFATEEYGRGIDFKVYDKKLEAKGMHVELTYWPDTLAEEIQIKGRTARQGNRGSFHIILNEDEIKDHCQVTTEDIDKHGKDGDLYEWLNGIRNIVFEKQYDEASAYVQELIPIHKKSEQLALALRRKKIKIAKELLLTFNKGANIRSAAKLSILIDATGSMGSCLNQCKTVLKKTVPNLLGFVQNELKLDDDAFEIQVIAYRNYNADANNILEYCNFTSNESKLTNFVHSITPKCGWGAEAVEIALGYLNRQEKKPNIVMLMADAPANSKTDIKDRKSDTNHGYGKEHWETQRGGVFKEDLDWNEELTKFMNENGQASVFCFYLENWAKDNFDEIAKIGNGKSKYLNINDEKASSDLLYVALSESILCKMNNGGMDYVEQFRAKNKGMPTFL